METFCTEEPLLVRGFNINFSPKEKFPKKKTLLNISFLNIAAETPGEQLTEYLSQYAYIVGTPLHIRKDHDEIPYYIGTRVHQVNRLYQHLPRHINEMFGQTVLCIYDNQPTNQFRQRNNTNRSYYYRQRTTKHYPTQNEGNTNAITTPIPKTKAKAKTNKNNNNRKQLQQLTMKYNNKIKLKTKIKNKKKQ